MLKFFAKYSKYIFFLCGLVLFIGLINDFGLESIKNNLFKTGWWLVPIIGIWAIVYLLNTLSFCVVLGKDRERVGIKNSLLITISGFAINYITPFASVGGEPYRVYKLKDYIGTPAAVSKVVLYKMIQLFSHFILWLLTILIMLMIFTLSVKMKLALGVMFAIIFSFGLLFIDRHKNGLLGFIYSGVKKLRIKPLVEFFRKREKSILESDENMKELYNERKGSFWLAVTIEFLARIVSSVEFYFILKSIGYDSSLMQSVYINSISSLFMNIFFFVPLELGIRESSLLLIMKTINITAGIGVFIALINRIREFFWIIVGLLLAQINSKKTLSSSLKSLKNGLENESISI